MQARGQTPPVIVDNPPLPPSTASVIPPLGETTIPAQPTPTAPTPPKPESRRRKPASKPANAAPAYTTPPAQEASNVTPAAVSAIGQLSSGDPGDYRQETVDSLAAIDRSLNSITRPLNDGEQKTADHIREFLKQARAALASGDVDGARTLAAKARILLNELTQ
jgi:hypothetical protein